MVSPIIRLARIGYEPAWVIAQPHGGAFVPDLPLFGQQINDRINDLAAGGPGLGRVGALDAAYVAREFHHGQLHAVADA